MRSFGGLGIAEEVIRAANWAVGSYLYSDRCLGVLDFDVSEPELRAYDTASLAALSALPSFGSPQIHQGTIGELHPQRCISTSHTPASYGSIRPAIGPG